MSSENEGVVRRLFQAINRGEIDVLEQLIAEDVTEHEELPGLEPNKEGVIAFFRHLRAVFPDLAMTPHDVVASGDRVAVRGTMTGTHQGEFMGIPATGNRMAVPFGDFFRLENGQIAEHWGVTDTGVMMQQLGVSES